MDILPEVERLIRTFLDAMELSVTPTITERDDHIRVDLTGPDSYLLLERKASVLDALQLIIGKIASSTIETDKRLVIDCDEHRLGLERELVSMAVQAADKVRKTGMRIELEPMNSYERRLVHMALKDEQGIASQSEGEGFLKRIVISPVP
jgi:spoIIIJ-associated protein